MYYSYRLLYSLVCTVQPLSSSLYHICDFGLFQNLLYVRLRSPLYKEVSNLSNQTRFNNFTAEFGNTYNITIFMVTFRRFMSKHISFQSIFLMFFITRYTEKCHGRWNFAISVFAWNNCFEIYMYRGSIRLPTSKNIRSKTSTFVFFKCLPIKINIFIWLPFLSWIAV